MFDIFKPKWQRGRERIAEDLDKKVKFKRELEQMLHDAWDSDIIYEGELAFSGRYVLEFNSLALEATTVFSPLVRFIVYDENLNIVYNLQDRIFNIMSNQEPMSRQRMLELEYWLSLDWKRD